MSVHISCPQGNAQPYRIVPSNGSFTMIANGFFDGATEAPSAEGTVGILAVFGLAKVFSGHLLAGSLGTPSQPRQIFPDSAGKWCLMDLEVPPPGAGSGSGASPAPYTIAVYDFDSVATTTTLIEFVHFQGQIDTTYQCVPCGSGSGSGSMPAQAAAKSASVPLAMVPLVWGLITTGLELGKSFLSGPLSLNFKDGSGGFCVWDNGADGNETPHVELRCESPLITTWRLTIRQGTDAPMVYVRSATEWNPLTANVVYRSAKTVVPAPEQLTLIPG